MACLAAYVLLGIMAIAGVATAVLITGSSSFLEFIVLLALLNGFSYLMLRGNTQNRFYLMVRVAVGIMLLEIILVGALIIARFVDTPATRAMDFIIPLGVIIGYELLKTTIRLTGRRQSHPENR